jgi:putative endonuclease
MMDGFRAFMASVYILYSPKLNRFYTGSCRDLTYRFKQHTEKEFKKSFTSQVDDWELFLSMDDLHYNQARKIERHIKAMKSKVYIQNLKKHSELLQKLIKKFE